METLERLLAQITDAAGMNASGCPVMTVSGNTTMIHFLLQLDAWTVFAAPYAPVSADPGFFWGNELDMDFAGLVYIIPAASNYVGGDIVSGLLTLGIHKKAETSLFFDIGTNGELVLGNRDWILAGAGAAGPALEGYISRYGMRAAEGAIDTVTIHGNKISYTTIGNQKPLGICGSGIIDLLAQMRLNGRINMGGLLEPEAADPIQYLNGELVAVYWYFPGYSKRSLYGSEEYLAGRCQSAADGSESSAGYKRTLRKNVLCSVCVDSGFSEQNAGGKVYSPHRHEPLSQHCPPVTQWINRGISV